MNEESVKNAIDIEAAKIDSREWAYAAIIARSEQHIKELEAEWKQKEDGWKRDNEPDWYIALQRKAFSIQCDIAISWLQTARKLQHEEGLK
jgi:hypothetical protein